jgi:DNA-binding GntR family transcriptional regulator
MHGTASSIVEHIKEKYSIIIGRPRDKYTARVTTFEELNLFQLITDEPVLILQRVSYTRDKKTLVLYSDMFLLGSWFAPEHEYDVHVWDG